MKKLLHKQINIQYGQNHFVPFVGGNFSLVEVGEIKI
jgi:hypothetical protein